MNQEQKKVLLSSIVAFLEKEVKSSATADFTESIEVAIQCLGSSYGLPDDCGSSAPCLDQIFLAGTKSLGIALPVQKEVTAEDRIKAEEMKARGNECMTENKYLEAVDSYSKAIDLDPLNAVYYGNRAAAYSKLNEHDSAIKDCEMALERDSSYSKAYGRMGYAYASLGNHNKAVESYEKALRADPSNISYQQNLETARARLQESGGSGGRPAGGSPIDLMGMLNNPHMMNMATQMMSSPHMQQMMAQMMGSMGGAGRQQAEAPEEGGAPEPQPDMAEILRMGQQFASQMQSQNPDLVASLRNQYQQENQGNGNAGNPPPSNDSNKGPPDYFS